MHRRLGSRVPSALAVAALVLTLMPSGMAVARVEDVALHDPAPVPSTDGNTIVRKLRGGLEEILYREPVIGARLPALVPGYRAGEIAYFVILSEPSSAAHRAALTDRGARVLRRYRTFSGFAVASRPADVLRVAQLP